MNLFRSEEHARNWTGFRADTEDGILGLSDMVRLFSGDQMTRRLDADYVSRNIYVDAFIEDVKEIAKSRPSWAP